MEVFDTRQCEHCPTVFRTTRKNKRYCSDECAVKAKNERGMAKAKRKAEPVVHPFKPSS